MADQTVFPKQNHTLHFFLNLKVDSQVEGNSLIFFLKFIIVSVWADWVDKICN